MDNISQQCLKSQKPPWTPCDHLMSLDLAREWQSVWTSSIIPKKHIITDPASHPPGFNLPCRLWTTLNCRRTNHGRCGYLMYKWKVKDLLSCDCRENIQTIGRIIMQFPIYGFEGELDDIDVTEESLKWLMDLQLHLQNVATCNVCA
ncbi:hypothetical protein UY3_01118 [Chelonia mydas]|uniref:Uncharacterized protein n=1 Tax=Chelonia mydas TaxID=8469 RepID=M7BWL3_CHEMY|nr:hypothetical protein UY3_01118 [Chelonia mydas]